MPGNIYYIILHTSHYVYLKQLTFGYFEKKNLGIFKDSLPSHPRPRSGPEGNIPGENIK